MQKRAVLSDARLIATECRFVASLIGGMRRARLVDCVPASSRETILLIFPSSPPDASAFALSYACPAAGPIDRASERISAVAPISGAGPCVPTGQYSLRTVSVEYPISPGLTLPGPPPWRLLA